MGPMNGQYLNNMSVYLMFGATQFNFENSNKRETNTKLHRL